MITKYYLVVVLSVMVGVLLRLDLLSAYESSYHEFEVVPYTSMQEDICAFSKHDYATINHIIELFELHTQTKIVDRLFTHKQIKELISTYTQEFVDNLRAIQPNCMGSNWWFDGYWSLEEITEWLQMYLQIISALRTYQDTLRAQPHQFSYAVDLLQSIFTWIGKSWDIWEMFSYAIQLSGSLNDQFPVYFHTDMDIHGHILDDWSYMDMRIEIRWSLDSVEESDQHITIWWVIDLLLLDDHIYAKREDIVIDAPTDHVLSEYISTFMSIWALIEGRWIELPVDLLDLSVWVWADLLDIDAIIMQTALPVIVSYQPMQTTRYWWINPMVCMLIPDTWWCLEMWYYAYEATAWKWYMQWYSQGGMYGLWLTSAFIHEERDLWNQTDLFASLMDIPLLRWNQDRISRFEVTFHDMFTLFYADNGHDIILDMSIDVADLLLEMHIVWEKQAITRWVFLEPSMPDMLPLHELIPILWIY